MKVMVNKLCHAPAELFWGDAAGLPAPEVHGQLTGEGDDGLLAFAGVGAALQQDVFPFLDGAALGLEADHAPGQFDEQISESGIAVLGDGQVHMRLAAGTDAAAEAGERADLFAVVKTSPVADFVGGAGQRQRAQTDRAGLAGLTDDGLGQERELLVHGLDHGAEEVEALNQPRRETQGQSGPGSGLPPVAFDAVALTEHEAAAHGFEPLAFAPELFALPADTAALFLLGRGHPDDGEGFAIAGEITVQPADELGGIGLVGVDALAKGIQFHGADDVNDDAPGLELAGQAETAGAGFIDGVNRLSQRQLLFDEAFEAVAGVNPLWRLGAGAIELADDAVIGGVLIHAQENPLAERVCPLRNAGDCVDVDWSVGALLGAGVGYSFHTNLRCRRSRCLPTLMTSFGR